MNKKTLQSYIFLLPAFMFLLFFTYYPFFRTVWTSLFQVDPTTQGIVVPFVGLQNYTKIMQDELFWKVVRNNLLFMVETVPTSVALGLLFAVLLNRKYRMNGLYRTLFFYPNILPMIAAANIWLFIYNPEIGLIKQVMQLFQSTGWNPLGDEKWVMTALSIMTVWKEAGYFMLFYLAGLQQLPRDVLEAGRLDGDSWNVFRHITFPLLGPTTLFVTIIALVNSFKMVDQVYVLTGGGPNNSSMLFLYYIYQVAFQFWNTSLASALTAILALFLALVMSIHFFVFDKKVHYQ